MGLNPLLDLNARLVIGHRGASAEAPENTLPAFQRAVEEGADALELDVQVTADDVAVVLHDLTLDRTTGASGPIALRRWDELRDVDAGYRFTTDGAAFPFRGKGVRIPALIEVLAAFPDVPLLIEIKVPEAQRAVLRAIAEAGAVDRCVVASEHWQALTECEPPYLRGASRRHIIRMLLHATFRAPLGPVPYRLLAIPDRYRGIPVATRRFIGAARRRGVPVHVWTVDNPERARTLWAAGAAGIITNVPCALRPAP